MPPVPPLPNKSQMENMEREKEEQTKRQVQGMSSASTGIEGYDFRIDDGQGQGKEQTQASVPSSTISTTDLATTAPNSKMNTPQRSRNTSSNKAPPSAAAQSNLNGDGTLKGRQRASLDTLALTADLSAFPLNFDEGRGSFGPSK